MIGADLAVLFVPFLDGSSNRVEAGTDLEGLELTALQVKENQGLRIATGCTSDTNINHIHDETKILPIEKRLRLHSSQLRQKASHLDHPLHRLTTQPQPP